jgi:hypothetical protein
MQGGAGMEGAGGRRTWAAAGSLHLKETEGKNEALSAQVGGQPLLCTLCKSVCARQSCFTERCTGTTMAGYCAPAAC